MVTDRGAGNVRKAAIVIVAFVAVLVMTAAVPWTSNQDRAHRIADLAREMGLPEESEIIKEAQFLWWAETEDARIVAKVLCGECLNCSDRHQQLTACSVYNRVRAADFPETVRGVVMQRGQYSPDYARNLPHYLSAEEATQRCFRNAYVAFCGETDCPDGVIYASEFPPSVLGSGCYEISKTYIDGILFSTTYFNYR